MRDGDLEFAEDFDLFAHAEGDAFEAGADEVFAGVACGESDEGGGGVGVGMGAAFAGEVGSEEEVFAAGGDELSTFKHWSVESTGVVAVGVGEWEG